MNSPLTITLTSFSCPEGSGKVLLDVSHEQGPRYVWFDATHYRSFLEWIGSLANAPGSLAFADGSCVDHLHEHLIAAGLDGQSTAPRPHLRDGELRLGDTALRLQVHPWFLAAQGWQPQNDRLTTVPHVTTVLADSEAYLNLTVRGLLLIKKPEAVWHEIQQHQAFINLLRRAAAVAATNASGNRDLNQADDFFQEGWMIIRRWILNTNLRSFEPVGSNFIPYLSATIDDRIAKLKRKRNRSKELPHSALGEVPDTKDDVEERDVRADFNMYLEQLPDSEKRILEMVLQGYSLMEMSVALGWGKSAAGKSQADRAFQKAMKAYRRIAFSSEKS
jgi:RNA polymerase sigma factor (sigma-70 family)